MYEMGRNKENHKINTQTTIGNNKQWHINVCRMNKKSRQTENFNIRELY